MTLMATTSAPAMPIDRSAVMSKVTRASRPITTVAPENTTARPALATDQAMARSTDSPRASSSRKRETMNSE